MEQMTAKNFAIYMADNLEGYKHFYEKAMDFQKIKNSKRAAKSRWNDYKLEKAVNEMWSKAMENLYNQIKPQVRKNEKIWGKKAWIDFMKEKELFETLNESLVEIEFEIE